MKVLFILFISIISIGYSQKRCDYSKRDIISIFKHINKSDASNGKNPEIRKKDFIHNFDTLIHLMTCSNFEIPTGNYSKKEIKKIEDGMRITIIHILQVEPSQILNDSIIDLFKRQIENFNLNRKTLITALSIYKYDNSNEFGNLRGYYLRALEKWKISEEELGN